MNSLPSRQTNLSEFKFPEKQESSNSISRLRHTNLLVSPQKTNNPVSMTKITNISINPNHKFLCASTNKGKRQIRIGFTCFSFAKEKNQE